MLEPNAALDWGGALAWFVTIAVASFSVSWFLTDLFDVHQSTYVGVLAILTGGLTSGCLVWSDQRGVFWTHHWAWGLLGAVVTGAFLARQVGRIPRPHGRGRPPGLWMGLWDGVIYGAAEGLLLSVLPVLTIWQAFAALGWTDGWRSVVAAVAALVGSALVIVVHHLGYREFRSRRVVQPVIACGVLSVAYLLTGSPIAAIGGHIVLHLAMLHRGIELPPHRHAATAVPAQRAPAIAR